MIAGILFVLMPVITWLILVERSSRQVELWCAGGALMGAGALLLGMRAVVPEWMSYPLANFLVLLGILTRIQSFRIEMGSPWRTSLVLMFSGLPILVFEFIRHGTAMEVLRLQYIHTVYALTLTYSAFIAMRFSMKFDNRSAQWIAAVSLLFAVAFLVRLDELTMANHQPQGTESTAANAFVAISGVVCAVLSHIAYVGMKLEQGNVRLEKAEHAYTGVLRAIRDGFFLADVSGRLLEVNAPLCRMLGYTREALLSVNFHDIDANLPRERSEKKAWSWLEANSEHFRTCYRRRDGGTVDVEVSVTFLPEGDGQLLGIVRDVTRCGQPLPAAECGKTNRPGELAA